MEIEHLSDLFVVKHSREYFPDCNKNQKKYIDIKGIGNFFSIDRATQVVEKYKKIKGFEDYPDGFSIEKVKIDSIYNENTNQLLGFPEKNVEKLKSVYVLYYYYEEDEGYEEILRLGIFSCKKNAEIARQHLLTIPSIHDYEDCLQIFEEDVNKENWSEGFITFDEAMDAFKEEKNGSCD